MKCCLLLLPLVLVACSPGSPTNGQAPPAPSATMAAGTTSSAVAADTAQLEHYHWRLIHATDRGGKRLDEFFVEGKKPLQLDFSDARLSLGNTCNHIGGRYRIVDRALHTSALVQTMMACSDKALMRRDQAASDFLQGNPSLELLTRTDTPQLVLMAADGTMLTFAGRPTAAMRYGSKGKTVFLEVAAQTVPCDKASDSGAQCLRVRQRHYDANGLKQANPGDWKVFHHAIKGYVHTDGVRNVLRVKRYRVADARANEPSVVYVLDMTVESEKVQP